MVEICWAVAAVLGEVVVTIQAAILGMDGLLTAVNAVMVCGEQIVLTFETGTIKAQGQPHFDSCAVSIADQYVYGIDGGAAAIAVPESCRWAEKLHECARLCQANQTEGVKFYSARQPERE